MVDSRLSELNHASLTADSVGELHALCDKAAQLQGFDHFVYGVRFPTSLTRPFVMIISGQPDEWRDRYQRGRYIRKDPVVHHAATHVRPARWTELQRQGGPKDADAGILREAAEFGLVTGICLPVRGSHGEVGLMSFSTERRGPSADRDVDSAQAHLYLFSSYVHEAVCRLVSGGALPYQPPDLTRRERECLLWAAEGKTAWETAHILTISERTVVFHLNNAVRKFDVSSRQQAVARAVALGLIGPTLN